MQIVQASEAKRIRTRINRRKRRCRVTAATFRSGVRGAIHLRLRKIFRLVVLTIPASSATSVRCTFFSSHPAVEISLCVSFGRRWNESSKHTLGGTSTGRRKKSDIEDDGGWNWTDTSVADIEYDRRREECPVKERLSEEGERGRTTSKRKSANNVRRVTREARGNVKKTDRGL